MLLIALKNCNLFSVLYLGTKFIEIRTVSNKVKKIDLCVL